MTEPNAEGQLSALALLDAYRSGDYESYRSVVDNSNPFELQGGLVQIADGLMLTVALASGRTRESLTEEFRLALLKVMADD